MNKVATFITPTEEASSWLRKIDQFGELISQHRSYSEQHKMTHPDVMDELFSAGLGKLSIPKAFRGHEVPLPTIVEILRRLSKYDPSVSWQVTVQVAMGRLADYLTEEAADYIYSNTKRFVIGAIHAGGTATPEGNGYRLSGRWSFASGSPHADWLVCTAEVEDNDGAKDPEVRMFFVPAKKCTVLDTWDTLGMRGTGSHDFACEGVWVDKKLSVDASLTRFRPQERDTLAYFTGYYDFGTIAAMATILGIAETSVDYFRRARKRPQDGSIEPVIAEKVGRALSLVYSADLLLTHAVKQALVPNDESMVGTHPRVAAAATMMTTNAVSATNEIYSLAGAGGVYKTNYLEQCFRDIHTGSKHFTLSPLNTRRLQCRSTRPAEESARRGVAALTPCAAPYAAALAVSRRGRSGWRHLINTRALKAGSLRQPTLRILIAPFCRVRARLLADSSRTLNHPSGRS